jgi:Tfp pilus assembly protein PilZ
LITLQEEGKKLDVKGTIVRSELSGIEQQANGQGVSIFTAGMMFNEGFADKLADFLKPIEQTRKKGEPPPAADRRLNVRFNITTPQEKILSYPLQFKVKSISLGGMLIQTEYAVEINSKIPTELSLNTDTRVTFIGRVVSCAMAVYTGQINYDIGVEFTDLTDEDKTLLNIFIDYLTGIEVKNKG